MCLLFCSYRKTPGYRLVIAANRDEFLKRPTARLDYIDKENQILAGLDLLGGGTWLGVHRDGRIGALTNYRKKEKITGDAPSRGEIVASYLSSKGDSLQFLKNLSEKASQYNGFSLILGDGNDLYYFNNQQNRITPLSPGFYGLSNHFLDSPWPKVIRGKDLLKPVMVDTDNVDPNKIFTLLKDDHCPPDTSLPDTGVGLEWERLLGSIFIDSQEYGTRSSAVITIGYRGETVFTEKTYDGGNKEQPGIVQFCWHTV